MDRIDPVLVFFTSQQGIASLPSENHTNKKALMEYKLQTHAVLLLSV